MKQEQLPDTPSHSTKHNKAVQVAGYPAKGEGVNLSSLNMPLMSPGMMAVLIAQFLSALADNAILIIAIAIVKTQGAANLVPVLQEAFVVPYILLAPFVGQLADRYPKDA
jgi:LPLT family lysophospholipid transporter-like MFS transporter